MRLLITLITAFALFAGLSAAQESYTLSTYYPAPNGQYQDMNVFRDLNVSGNTGVATVNVSGNLLTSAASRVGFGVAAPVGTVHFDVLNEALFRGPVGIMNAGRFFRNSMGPGPDGLVFSNNFFIRNTAGTGGNLYVTGNAGIGTVTSTASLNINGSIQFHGISARLETADSASISSRSILLGSGDSTASSSGNLSLRTGSAAGGGGPGNISLTTGSGGGTIAGHISMLTGQGGTSSGNITIQTGTTAQQSGNITIQTGGASGAGDITIRASNGTAGGDVLVQAGGGTTPGTLTLNGGGHIIMNAAGQGNIGIRTNNPTSHLTVNGTFSAGSVGAGAVTTNSLAAQNITFSTPGNFSVQSVASFSNGIQMTGGNFTSANGNITLTNGTMSAASYLHSSDARLKENIQPLDQALSKILQLKGVTFQFKGKTDQKVGLIAQDVEKIFPECVSLNADGFKSVDYASLVAPLVEALKTQNARIQELEKQQADFESMLRALSSHARP